MFHIDVTMSVSQRLLRYQCQRAMVVSQNLYRLLISQGSFAPLINYQGAVIIGSRSAGFVSR